MRITRLIKALSVLVILLVSLCWISFHHFTVKSTRIREHEARWLRLLDVSNSSISNTCQNTEQGDTIVADETGALCSRDLILPSGCCPDPSEGKDTGTHRFVCDQCNADHCCGIYEHCVSCCLDQRHVALRLQVLKASQSSSRHLSLASTPFEFCASICRTSSRDEVHHALFPLASCPSSYWMYTHYSHFPSLLAHA